MQIRFKGLIVVCIIILVLILTFIFNPDFLLSIIITFGIFFSLTGTNGNEDSINPFEIKNTSDQTLDNQNTITMTNQKHGFPALLSFFLPGVGQLVKGHILKAILIWIVGTIVTVFFWWTIVVPFTIWAWNVYDAYNSN